MMSSPRCLIVFVAIIVIPDNLVAGVKETQARDQDHHGKVLVREKRDMQGYSQHARDRRLNNQLQNNNDEEDYTDLSSFGHHRRRIGLFRGRQRRTRDGISGEDSFRLDPMGGPRRWGRRHGMRQGMRQRMRHGRRNRQRGPWSNRGSNYGRESGSPDADGNGFAQNGDRDRFDGMNHGRSHGMHHGRSHGMHHGRSHGMHHGGSPGMHHGGSPGMHHGRSHGMLPERSHGMHNGRWSGRETGDYDGMHYGRPNRMRHGYRGRGYGCPHCGRAHSRFNGEWRGNGDNWLSRRNDGDLSERNFDPDTNLPRLSVHAKQKINFLSRAQNRLTAQLYPEIALPETNVVLSPYGLFQTLSMGYFGAQGHTAFQMIRFLKLIGMGRHVHLPVIQQNILMEATGNTTLETASGVFLHPNMTISETFTEQMETSFGANASYLDFEHTDGAEGSVNEWMADQTNELIQGVLPTDSVSKDTSMILVSAMFFHGKWKTPFSAHRTVETMFTQASAQQVPVQMMELTGRLKMGVLPGHNARMLELPYEGDRFSMLVFLPDDVDGLPAIEEELSAETLAVHLDTVLPSDVKVFLPRFRLESTFSLKDHLQNLGLTRPFDPELADFRSISSNYPFLSDVIHKAVVDVNEGESGAASTTGMGFDRTSPEPEFRCDQPFLFIIRDNVSKINLFIGKYSGEF